MTNSKLLNWLLILPILALAVWSFTAPLGELSVALMIPGSIYIAACAYKRELS